MENHLSEKNTLSINPVQLGLRFANWVIDNVTRFLIMTLIQELLLLAGYKSFFAWLNTGDIYERIQKEAPFEIVIIFLYYFLFEVFWQRTPAKFITKTYVIRIDGNLPSYKDILLRTIIRFVPFEALSFLGQRPLGWHDKWSKTQVVSYAEYKL